MTKTLIALLSMLCLSMTPAALAAEAAVVVSGRCHDADANPVVGDGGSASLGVSSAGSVDALDAAEALSAAGALVTFVDEPAQVPSRQGCSAPGDDHLDAYVALNGDATGVCYDDTQTTC